MFFINKGIVEVVSEHENPIIFDTMEPGRFFGEISTIFSCPRTASIRYGKILFLDWPNLTDVFSAAFLKIRIATKKVKIVNSAIFYQIIFMGFFETPLKVIALLFIT